MIEMLSMPFMQRAIIGGVLVGLLASYYGVFVVQRGLAFLGSGLAHAAFGGVALGVLLEQEPLWVAIPFTVVVAVAIIWVRERTQLGEDTSIGIFFSLSMALGIILLSLREGYSGDAFAYLFGSILSITSTDLWVAGGVTALSLAALPLWSRWAYATFDRNLALADRLAVLRDDYLLSILMAVTIVVSVKVVGIVLIAAFLVIPAATARLLATRFAQMTLLSMAVGVLSVFVGLAGSYQLDLPSGACIIVTQTLFFAGALALRR